MEELPDVGSIQPLTEAEARKTFGTPLQRLLKIDPISVQRDPVKRGIVSIGTNIRDMLLPEFGLEQAVKEGDPVQMAISAFDYVIANPAVALLTKSSKSILQLAKDLQKMNPEEAAKVKESVNRLIQREKDQLDYELGYLDDQGYRLPGYETAKKRLEILEENESIINKVAGKKPRIPDNVFYAPTKNLDELKNLSPEDSKKVLENIKKEKRSIKRMPEVQMYGPKEKAEVFRDIDDEFKEAIDILNQNINKKLKMGGPVDKPLYDDQKMI